MLGDITRLIVALAALAISLESLRRALSDGKKLTNIAHIQAREILELNKESRLKDITIKQQEEFIKNVKRRENPWKY